MFLYKIIPATLIVLISTAVYAQTNLIPTETIAPPVDRSLFVSLPQEHAIRTKDNIAFDGRSYVFGFGDIKENQYFTIGDKYNNWSSMIAVHDFPNMTDPLNTAEAMYDKLIGDGKTAQLVIHRFSKEPILTFFLEKPDNWELNIWRFYQNKNQTAVIALQFAKGFKIPQIDEEKQNLKTAIKSLTDQFLNLPKQPFVF